MKDRSTFENIWQDLSRGARLDMRRVAMMECKYDLQEVVPDCILANVLTTFLRRVDNSSQISSSTILKFAVSACLKQLGVFHLPP
jgi:hypothetical protein